MEVTLPIGNLRSARSVWDLTRDSPPGPAAAGPARLSQRDCTVGGPVGFAPRRTAMVGGRTGHDNALDS